MVYIKAMPREPEYASVLTFVEFLLEEGRTTFQHYDAGRLSAATGRTAAEIRAELQSWGLRVEELPRPKGRGFLSSSHDRYFGPGSEKMHGGSGWEQVNGFAGDEG